MQKLLIDKEAVFQVPVSKFCIGYSSSGYTLAFSADGVDYTPYSSATPADTAQVVVNACSGMYFKLAGNTDTAVPITW